MKKEEEKRNVPFLAARNRIRIYQQYKEILYIADKIGELIKKPGDSLHLKEMVCSLSFMAGTLSFLLAEAGTKELESQEVEEIIERAEIMNAVMKSAVCH